jgi:hypothetical protein
MARLGSFFEEGQQVGTVANISNPGERRGVAWNEMVRVFDPLMRVSM